MQQNTINNRSIFGNDNLEIIQGIDSNSIDLIYLDPPFNKKKIFTAPIGSSAEGASFSDIFRKEDIKDEWIQTIKEDQDKLYGFLNGIKNIEGKTSYNYCYLCYMAIRLIEFHRTLKNTGSIYLHCDPTMSHYLKLLLDCIFGEKNFRGNIIWKRHNSVQKGSQFKAKSWGYTTDDIFHYTKSNIYFLNNTKRPNYDEIKNKFTSKNEQGEYYYNDSAHLFRNKGMGARPNLCYEWRGFKNPNSSGWRLSKEQLEEEYQKGNIVINGNKIERRKYLKDYKGIPVGNLWTDISPVYNKSERTGYPTQKPLALLERIIKASSNEGDVVLDPFCGCATTCIAAEKLNRQWIGIDISVKAYELVKQRLKKEVANPEDLFQHDNIVTYSQSTPQRTDQKQGDNIHQKWVYVISNEQYPGEYKVGIAKDWKSRLNSYQTSDPNRNYKLEHKILTPHFRALEKYIHDTFDNRHEWVQADLKKLIQAIDNY